MRLGWEERKKEAKNKNKECSPRASVPQWPHSIRRGCNISGQILQNPPTLGYLQRLEMCKLFCLKNVSGGSFHNFIRVDICFASFDDKIPTLSPYQRTTFILCASTLIKEVYIISKTRLILSSTYKYREGYFKPFINNSVSVLAESHSKEHICILV